MAFGGQGLCVLVLHFAGQNSCLELHFWPRDIWRTGGMCTCIIFCWIRQLFNTTLTGPVPFGVQELCVHVLHSAETDSHLKLLNWSCGIWWTRVMCTCITFCWIKQLFITTLIGAVVIGGRELCVLVLHSADQKVI